MTCPFAQSSFSTAGRAKSAGAGISGKEQNRIENFINMSEQPWEQPHTNLGTQFIIK